MGLSQTRVFHDFLAEAAPSREGGLDGGEGVDEIEVLRLVEIRSASLVARARGAAAAVQVRDDVERKVDLENVLDVDAIYKIAGE